MSGTLRNFLIFTGLLLFTVNLFAAKGAAPEGAPVLVEAVKAKRIEWQPVIQATGTLVAEQGIEVKPDISGRVTQIFFKSGQYIHAGEPLVQIFPDILQAQLKQNEAQLKLTQLSLKRFSDLFKTRAASQSDYDNARADYEKAAAALEETKARLAQTLIKAPFSGYLGIRKINAGDYISAGQAIVNLESTNPIFVDFSIPEFFSKQVETGQTVVISAQTYGDRKFQGTVKALESLINPDTRTLEVRASIPNEDNYLIPGSFVMVSLYVGKKQPVISIPQTAIVYTSNDAYVYKIENHKAIKVPVTLGERGTENIHILSGLHDGDWVVTAGQQKLSDNAPVKIAADHSA